MAIIHKKEVANGVYWLDIPKANLRILCGCPADVVKYLMKRGLIINQEKNGVVYESGPNAILLSEISVQFGDLANMSEFPILQMLYKQGMLIPNHPNNTGEKPILIGTKEQVRSQLQYIYRGNYGLISQEEIMETGITREHAYDMMRLKKKFAFGQILQSEKFLQSCEVSDGYTEIKNGVTIKRIEVNQFEIKFKDKFVHIDLNITTPYESPYKLGFYNIKREYFAIIHSGQGDGWNIHQPSMSSILIFQGKIYLIDAGPNIVYILTALGIGINEIEGIFHTHAHDDHFAGITALIRAGHKIKYFATRLVRASVEKKLSALFSSDEKFFAEFFDIHDLEFDTWNLIEGLEVKPIFSPHPLECSIFFFRTMWRNGYKEYAHLADITSNQVLDTMITDNNQENGISRKFVRAIKEQYLKPVDLKKIDIGGGMIHGEAIDFRKDKSQKIVLAHTSHSLEPFQKEIGSDAEFGSVDVLIQGRQNYEIEKATRYLTTYFRKPNYLIKIIANNDIITFNPGTILIKQGDDIDNIYLVLTGIVEMIHTEKNIYNLLSAGSFIGESAGLKEGYAQETYRALSYVRALEIPRNLYVNFVENNQLFEKIDRLRDNRNFLRKTSLFGEGISYKTQNRIAKTMHLCRYPQGHVFKNNYQYLFLIKNGIVECKIAGETIETLKEGDHFGADIAVFHHPGIFQFFVKENIEVYELRNHFIRDIPIIRWKLFEKQEKRKKIILKSSNNRNFFVWNDDYRIHVESMDRQHQRLFELSEKVHDTIESDIESLYQAIEQLFEYTNYHFKEEEKLLQTHNYPDFKDHKEKHDEIIRQINALAIKFKNEEITRENFLALLKDWIFNHILIRDRDYSKFLNEKGIF